MLDVKFQQDKYTRDELVTKLQELADIFVESEEEYEFMVRANYIIFCYDYLVTRLELSEAERFKGYIK